MSGRGGGRRSDQHRDQPPQTAGQQSSRRQGGGRGRRRGRGGGGGEGEISSGGGGGVTPVSSPSIVSSVAPVPSVAASGTSPPPASSGTSPPPASSGTSPPPASSTSGAVVDLSGEVDKRLTLQPTTTVIQAPPPSSSKAVRHPVRPGYGTVGTKCVVRANHFLVEVADRDLHHYDVSISPEVTSRKLNRDVMSELIKIYWESHLGKRMPAYDGMKSLYTAGPLPFFSKEFVVKLLKTDSGPGSSGSTRRDRDFKVAIKFASKPDLHHLQQFLKSRQLDVPQETIQVLDVVLRAAPSQKYTVVGRSFFSPDLGPRGDLGDGIEFWRGYYQSLRPTQMGLSLNIDVSARSFYDPILVTEFIGKHFNLRDLSRRLPDRDFVKMKKALRGVKVQLANRVNSKRYKITGISSRTPSELMFTLEDKKTEISVAQYFCEKYNVVLQYPYLPALQSGSDSKPEYLPMELCRIVEGQRYTKKLNERQVTSLLRATCQRPPQRESSIKQTVGQNNFNGDFLVSNEFGMKLREECTIVDARVLPPPMLKYHDSGKEQRESPKMGQWNMINKKMFNGGKVEFWTCVSFSTRVHPDMPFQFCAELVAMCNSKGMAFNPNPVLPISTSRSDRIVPKLVDIHKQATAKLASMGPNKQLQLLIIILPDVTGSYGIIKRVCETELGIVTQCCHPKNAVKMQKQYFENVALKINVKVGGRNLVLNDAIQRRIPLVSDRPTIIIGADVTHPTPGEDSSPSIAAVVASMDWPEVTKYRGLVSAQPHREEIIQDLYKITEDPKRGSVHGGMIRELFVAFRRSTGHKPNRIIFYRDGVSEGQFSQVLLYEMDAIRKACASLEEGYLPPVTFIVVQKRHHTRLFPVDRNMTDRSGNIQPGTVVDTKICHPTEFDFYLNSHAGIQGTSRPAHYHVLYDENKFTADALQVLTNNLCYTYARCTRSVSIVPPAYYAHLAAFRARYYIEDDSAEGGSTASGRGGGRAEVRALPVIKDNVKDVMFYC